MPDYTLGGQRFRTKTEITAFMREHLYGACASWFPGDPLYEVFMALMASHAHRDEKLRWGCKRIEKGRSPGGQGDCFYFVGEHGRVLEHCADEMEGAEIRVDVSFTTCISRLGRSRQDADRASNRAHLAAAYRTAVYPQVLAYRQQSDMICAVCGRGPLEDKQAQVDHLIRLL